MIYDSITVSSTYSLNRVISINKCFDAFQKAWQESDILGIASKYSDTVSAAVSSDPKTSKRRRIYPNNSIASSPLTVDMTHTASEVNQAHLLQQSQSYGIPTDSLSSSGHEVGSGGCDSTDTNSRATESRGSSWNRLLPRGTEGRRVVEGFTRGNDVATDNITHPSPVSLSSNADEAYRTVLRQDLQHSSQLGVSPTSQKAHSQRHINAASLDPTSSKCFDLGAEDFLTTLQAVVFSEITPSTQQDQSLIQQQSERTSNTPLSENNVSLGISDSSDTNDTSGRAIGNATHQRSNDSMQETQGSILHDEEPIREDVENGPSDNSNTMPSSFPMDPERHQGQEHIYQYNMEANNLMGTDEQGQSLQMRLDGGQNGMCAALNKLDIALIYKLRAIHRH